MNEKTFQSLLGFWQRPLKKSTQCHVLKTATADVRICSQLSWEIIIVDDASPDGTQDVARELAKVYGEDKIVSRL